VKESIQALLLGAHTSRAQRSRDRFNPPSRLSGGGSAWFFDAKPEAVDLIACNPPPTRRLRWWDEPISSRGVQGAGQPSSVSGYGRLLAAAVADLSNVKLATTA